MASAASPAHTSSPPASSDAPVLREIIGNVAVLTLNRPTARNTLSEEMLAALGRELAEIAGNARVRAVVIAANGPAFSAGHDLKQLTAHRVDADSGRSYTRQMMESCSGVMMTELR